MIAATTLAYTEPTSQWAPPGSELEYPRNVIASPRAVHAATNEYTNSKFATHFAKLRAIANQRSLLPEGAEAPTGLAVNWARAALQQLQEDEFPPTRVVAAMEGGVAICFVYEDKYADLESLNSGEILGVTSNRRDPPIAWEIEPSSVGIARAIVRIRQFFRGSTPRQDAQGRAWSR
jgi:hypothetical protein